MLCAEEAACVNGLTPQAPQICQTHKLLLGSDPDQHHAVHWHISAEFITERAEVLLEPKILDTGFSAETDFRETHRHLLGCSLAVEQTHDFAAVSHWLHPNLERT